MAAADHDRQEQHERGRHALDNHTGGRSNLYDDRLDIEAEQHTVFVFAQTVDRDTTLTFRVERPATAATTTNSWDASVPTWGGNKCMIEPPVQVTSEGIDIGPRCVA